MNLEDLIKDTSQRGRIAAAAGINPDYLWQVATGRRKASHTVARAIEAATDRQVTIHDLRPDIFGPAPQKEAA